MKSFRITTITIIALIVSLKSCAMLSKNYINLNEDVISNVIFEEPCHGDSSRYHKVTITYKSTDIRYKQCLQLNKLTGIYCIKYNKVEHNDLIITLWDENGNESYCQMNISVDKKATPKIVLSPAKRIGINIEYRK
ncbi:hypothetical protein Barb6_02697 [Bacteroidales bacterium Barb6]|nr:hypothetical protein Barb6_02697 [Bacteroidales bacterium Barb6]